MPGWERPVGAGRPPCELPCELPCGDGIPLPEDEPDDEDEDDDEDPDEDEDEDPEPEGEGWPPLGVGIEAPDEPPLGIGGGLEQAAAIASRPMTTGSCIDLVPMIHLIKLTRGLVSYKRYSNASSI
jgi:hypothetical protein